ncbi:MAG: alpha/beta hydrolase [Chloroflexota bacterium]|nr:alpha/beta hydrolase [Chloroflexota bacterium]
MSPVREVQVREVEYRREGSESWLAKVYRPAGTGPFPALLDVHGGAWSGGTRENNASIHGALAARGLVIVAIDFRLAPEHPYPASIQDTNYATRWVKRNAGDLGLDPRRVGGLGSSSGGHMVLLSALRPRDPRYAALPLPEEEGDVYSGAVERDAALPLLDQKGDLEKKGALESGAVDASLSYVILLWAVIDPYARYRFAQRTGRIDLVERSEGYFRSVASKQEGNPQRIVAAWPRSGALPPPPVLLIQGTDDANLPPGMAETFAETYRAAGGAIDVHLFPGQPHGFGVQPGHDAERAQALMQEFILQRNLDAK